ncbi:KAP family P-loop domain protein [compost metagenome]
MNSRSFISDTPINNPEEDRFQRWPFAQRVAQTIALRRDPESIVLGIYGAWGNGKTSVMNFINKELSDHEHVVIIRFNPWLFKSEEQIIQAFFLTLADALGKSLTTQKEKIGEMLEKYISIIGSPWSLGEGIREFGKALNGTAIEEYRDRVEKLLQQQHKRIVIFMDDIDRLEKTEIQTVFKLVKLTGDFAYTTYVLAFDEEMVAAALGEKYGGGGIEAGRHFLEKIVQVPLYLPIANQETLRKYCFEGLDEALNLAGIELTTAEIETFAYYFNKGFENRLQTPRVAKRYINALTFALPLLKDEINPVDLMLIEGIRIFYPRLYEHIRVNPNLYISQSANIVLAQDDKKEDLEIFQQGMDDLSIKDKKCAESLVKFLFPKIGSLLDRISWPSRSAKEKSISSASYFLRYFLYTVPDVDVSDAIVSSFLDDLEKMNVEEVLHRFEVLIEGRPVDRFLEKLQQYWDMLSPSASEVLAKALSQAGHHFPREGSFFNFFTPSIQSAILIAMLLRNIQSERIEVGKAIIRDGQPLSFALNCFEWIQYNEKAGQEKAIFSKEEEGLIAYELVARIKELAEREVLYLVEDQSIELLSIWAKWGSREETNQYLQRTFQQESTNVFRFLKLCLSRSRTLGSNVERFKDFQKNNYHDLQSIVDVDAIFIQLKKIYGVELNDPVYEPFKQEPTDRSLAMQFAYFHKQIMNGHDK